MGDADYLYAFQQIVMPIAYDFNPDLVISQFLLLRCRFDAYFFQLLLASMLLLEISLGVASSLQHATLI